MLGLLARQIRWLVGGVQWNRFRWEALHDSSATGVSAAEQNAPRPCCNWRMPSAPAPAWCAAQAHQTFRLVSAGYERRYEVSRWTRSSRGRPVRRRREGRSLE